MMRVMYNNFGLTCSEVSSISEMYGNILIDILIHQNGNIVIQTLQFKLKNGVNANDLIRACFQTGMLDLTSVATLV